jgi:hypothetical protein
MWDEIDVNVEDLRSLLAERTAQAERMPVGMDDLAALAEAALKLMPGPDDA